MAKRMVRRSNSRVLLGYKLEDPLERGLVKTMTKSGQPDREFEIVHIRKNWLWIWLSNSNNTIAVRR